MKQENICELQKFLEYIYILSNIIKHYRTLYENQNQIMIQVREQLYNTNNNIENNEHIQNMWLI